MRKGSHFAVVVVNSYEYFVQSAAFTLVSFKSEVPLAAHAALLSLRFTVNGSPALFALPLR